MNWVARLLAMTALAHATGAAAAPPDHRPLYFQDPTGAPYWSAEPRKDSQGRNYVPVYQDRATSALVPAPAPAARGKPLYYRNPMGLPDTSPVPKKDSMGMDYVPVYPDEVSGSPGSVTISPERVQMLGVRTEMVAERMMTHPIRAVGTVAVDERRVAVVAPRFEGFVEKLLVSASGDPVRRGQPLLEAYSPELAQAEQDYVVGRQVSATLGEAALTRLRNLNAPPDEVARLRRTGRPGRTVSVSSPMDAVVMEKAAVQGMRFTPGETLYRLADLSNAWLLADVFEQDLALVRPGQDARISIAAYPNQAFGGKVTFVYPTVNATTRTAKVRIEVPNKDMLLKPDMYATVEIAAPLGSASVLAVPNSAVLDTGTTQVVLVERSPGHFEPHAVIVGRRADGYTEVRSGVSSGDKIVVGANFLIDAESNLRAALQSFTAPAGPEGSKP